LYWNWSLIPLQARGVFNIESAGLTHAGIHLGDISDGTSNTIAAGDAASGSKLFKVRNPSTGATMANNVLLIQAWGAANVGPVGGGYTNTFYGSVFAVTDQTSGTTPEPMNRNPATPTAYAGDPTGSNSGSPLDYISGFRSNHPNGCNLLFCDGSVRFVQQDIPQAIYQALSTYAGNEAASDDY
jgi:prepilin-type processing-associated H-X9-DG protein